MSEEWMDEDSLILQNMSKKNDVIIQLKKERNAYKRAYEILEGSLRMYRIGDHDLEKARRIIEEALKEK